MANYSGYGNWNAGGNRGYEDYGYGYEQDASANSGSYGYESYESYDSRPSLNHRDLYRSGYDYSEAQHDTDNAYEGRYDSSYGNRRGQFQTRARSNFPQRGQTSGRDGRKTRPLASFPGRMSGPWNEPQQPMGGWGSGASGFPRPPLLFAQKQYPNLSLFQGMRGFSGNRRFGGGGLKQRRGKNIQVWDEDKSQLQTDQQKKKIKKESVAAKKRIQTNTTGEPESKVAKNEDGDEAAAEEKSADDAEAAADGEAGADKGSLTIEEEISELKQKFQAGKKMQDRQKKRQRDRMVERIQYVCSLCKFRTYDDEMNSHLESKFHSDHFSFVGTKLPKQTAEFLQEYVSDKHKKTVERRRSVEDNNAAIQQIFKDQDLTLDLGMDHFVKKVEAAHCTACDLLIPMHFGILQKHQKSMEHNQNRKAMMDQSKKTALIVAKSILNNKMICKKLERNVKGENPFVDEPKEKTEAEEAGEKESAEDGTAEGTEESSCEEGMETEGTSEDQTGKESVDDQSALTADEEERLLEAGDEESGDEDGAEAEEEEEGGEEAEPME